MGSFGENFGVGFDVPGAIRGKFGEHFGQNFDLGETIRSGGAALWRYILKKKPQKREYHFITEIRAGITWNERTLLTGGLSNKVLSPTTAKIAIQQQTPIHIPISNIIQSPITAKVEWRKPRLKKLMRLYLIEELANLQDEGDTG